MFRNRFASVPQPRSFSAQAFSLQSGFRGLPAVIVACLVASSGSAAAVKLKPFLDHQRIVQQPGDPAVFLQKVKDYWVTAHRLLEAGQFSNTLGQAPETSWSAHELMGSESAANPNLPVDGILMGNMTRIGKILNDPGRLSESILAVVNVPDPALAERIGAAVASGKSGTQAASAVSTSKEGAADLLMQSGEVFDSEIEYIVIGPTIGGRIASAAGWSLSYCRIGEMDLVAGPHLAEDLQPLHTMGQRVWATTAPGSPEAETGVKAFGFDVHTQAPEFVQPWLSYHDVMLPGVHVDEIVPSDRRN